MLEMLHRISRIFKDYCGTLSEDTVRKNFILIYELLDEALDYGYPQAIHPSRPPGRQPLRCFSRMSSPTCASTASPTQQDGFLEVCLVAMRSRSCSLMVGSVVLVGVQAMSTELIKPFVYSEPAAEGNIAERAMKSLMPGIVPLSQAAGSLAMKIADKKTLKSSAANRAVVTGADAAKSKDNTIFVDVFEKIAVRSLCSSPWRRAALRGAAPALACSTGGIGAFGAGGAGEGRAVAALFDRWVYPTAQLHGVVDRAPAHA